MSNNPGQTIADFRQLGCARHRLILTHQRIRLYRVCFRFHRYRLTHTIPAYGRFHAFRIA